MRKIISLSGLILIIFSGFLLQNTFEYDKHQERMVQNFKHTVDDTLLTIDQLNKNLDKASLVKLYGLLIKMDTLLYSFGSTYSSSGGYFQSASLLVKDLILEIKDPNKTEKSLMQLQNHLTELNSMLTLQGVNSTEELRIVLEQVVLNKSLLD